MPKRKRGSSRAIVSSRPRSRSFRKRVSRMRTRVSRRMRVSRNYTFSRWLIQQNVVNMAVVGGTYTGASSILSCGASVTEVNVGQNYTLDSLPNVSEFTTLFDQYKIRKVICQIKMLNVPENTYAAMSNNANYGNFYPTIWWVNDKDDSGPYTLAQIKEVQGVRHRVLRPNSELNMVCSPSILGQLYRTSITTGYKPQKGWIDIGQTNVPHYANKFVIDLEGLNTSVLDPLFLPRFKINYRMFFECKGVR